MGKWSRASRENAVNADVALIDGCTMHLYTNTPTITSDSVAGDFTESAASGYAAQSVVGANFGAAGDSGDGRARSTTVPITFTLTLSGMTTETVKGWYVLDGGGAFVAGEAFPADVTFTATLATLDLDLTLSSNNA